MDLSKFFREDEENSGKHGHITSLAVSKNYRRLGLAEKLMKQAGIKRENENQIFFLEKSLFECYDANSITLHVRKSNLAALNLYEKKLGFRYFLIFKYSFFIISTIGIDAKYYADGEDAYSMKKIAQ